MTELRRGAEEVAALRRALEVTIEVPIEPYLTSI